ncbi:MAG: tyrosine-type recombinase/integrase, partial [Rhodoferax sp.]|nr:tyrosine-type recombinase/integrase [Rhodoferax sp.]
MSVANLAKHLQQFFTGHLHGQLGASRHTVARYRDTFRLLLKFAAKQFRRQASDLRVEDLEAKLVSAFLNHLEHDRHNGARTRNNRLSAIHAFFGYVSVNEPALANHCQRVLAIPPKRFERGAVQFLSEVETAALLKAPDTRTWLGRRDHLLLQVALQTGLRNSELIRLRRQDIELGTGAHVRCLGKGRKSRCTPIRADLAARLLEWIAEQPSGPTTPIFPTAKGNAMSSDALQRLVARHIRTAARTCVSLQTKKVTPHTLRHSLAMSLLQRGGDITVIALWLGHESIDTT